MELNTEIKKITDPIYQKISKVIPEIEWAFHAPLIHKINILKKEKLTTRDSRSVERKKPGRKKARRSFQFSKR